MKVSTNQYFAELTRHLTDQQAQIAKLHANLATGDKFLSPSDDADSAVKGLSLKSIMAEQDAQADNLQRLESRLGQEEAIISSMRTMMTRMQELAIQASNGTYNENDRKIIAVEVQAYRNEILLLANSRDTNGSYLFAGARSGSPPFVSNTVTAVTAVSEVATITGASGLTAGQAFSIGGLTYVSTGVTTQAELLSAFEGLANGAAGNAAGLLTGTYSGALSGYSTGAVTDSTVVFTASATGVKDDLVVSGTGAAAASVVITTQGVTGVDAGNDVSYAGDANRMYVEMEAGQHLVINTTGYELFSGGGSTRNGTLDATAGFAILDNFISALENSDMTEISASLGPLDSLRVGMETATAKLGVRRNMIDLKKDVHVETRLTLESMLARERDLDYTKAITELSSRMLALEAAQSTMSRISQLTLFNYLS